jgi:hypothetical protein
MPMQIDHVETHIEIATPTRGALGASSVPAATPQAIAAAVAEARAQIASSMGAVLSSELDRFLKIRGM